MDKLEIVPVGKSNWLNYFNFTIFYELNVLFVHSDYCSKTDPCFFDENFDNTGVRNSIDSF